jgi:hypothetical protein
MSTRKSKKAKPLSLDELKAVIDKKEADIGLIKRDIGEAERLLEKLIRGKRAIDDIEEQRETIRTLKDHLDLTKKEIIEAQKKASEAAIEKRKRNELEEQERFFKQKELNNLREEEEIITTRTKARTNVVPITSEAFKAFASKKLEEEKEKRAKRELERIRQMRLQALRNNIQTYRKTLKKKNIPLKSLIKTTNLESIVTMAKNTRNIDKDDFTRYITIAYESNTRLDDVFFLFDTYPDISDKQAITFLLWAHKLTSDEEAIKPDTIHTLIDLLSKTDIPFDAIIDYTATVKENPYDVYYFVRNIYLAYLANVPYELAVELSEAKREHMRIINSLRTTHGPSYEIFLLRLAHLSNASIEDIFEYSLYNEDTLKKIGVSNILNIIKNNSVFSKAVEEQKELNRTKKPNSPIKNTTRKLTTASKLTFVIPEYINTKKSLKEWTKVVAKKVEKIAETYDKIKVSNLPITDMIITKERRMKDLEPIINKVKGILGRAIFGKQKGIPLVESVYVPVKGIHPVGYVIVKYSTHEDAKKVINKIQEPGIPNPTFDGMPVDFKDIEISYGDKYFME